MQLARALLNGQRLIALVGTGGIGKTWLASVGARRLAWRFPGGVFWRSAADIADFRLDHLLDAFAPIFGQQFYTLPTPAKRDLVLQYLRDLRTNALIVVDNAETIKDDAVWKFLTELPDPSAAIITTRYAPEYGCAVIDVRGMEPEESVNLFIIEADRVKNGAQWLKSEDDLKRVFDICALLDGHPLAILIAAALLRGMNLTSALAQVKANPSRGEVSKRFDFSYNPLPAAEKDLLHRLAAFASHVPPLFIDNLCTNTDFCGDSPLLTWQTDLVELVRKSFVEHLEFGSEDDKGNSVTIDRYRLHPVMRDYAAHKAGAEIMRRHNFSSAKLLVAFTEQFSDSFDALENELPNLLGAMDWADEERQDARGKTQEAARLVTGIAWTIAGPDRVLGVHGHWSEAKRRLLQAAEVARQLGDTEDEAAFIANAAIVTQSQGDVVSARLELERVKAIFEKIDRKDAVASILHQLAMLAQGTGDLTEARRLYEQSLQMLLELDNKQGIAKSLHQLGILAQVTGDLTEARRLYDEAGKIFKELGAKQEQAAVLHQLGRLAQDTGELAEARRLYEQSLQRKRELGDKQGIAKSLHQLGRLAQDAGDLTEAHRLYDEAGKIFKELGAKQEQAAVLHQLGRLAQDTGELAKARRLYEQSLQIERELGNKQGIATTLAQTALLEEQEGHVSTALSLIQRAEQLFTELGSPMRERARKDRERLEMWSNE